MEIESNIFRKSCKLDEYLHPYLFGRPIFSIDVHIGRS